VSFLPPQAWLERGVGAAARSVALAQIDEIPEPGSASEATVSGLLFGLLGRRRGGWQGGEGCRGEDGFGVRGGIGAAEGWQAAGGLDWGLESGAEVELVLAS